MDEKMENATQPNGKSTDKVDVVEEEKKKKSIIRMSLTIKISLAIIFLSIVIISSVSGYFIVRESKILTEQTFQFVEREIVHMRNIATDSYGADELSLVKAIDDVKMIKYFQYAYFLSQENIIIRYFDRDYEKEIRKKVKSKSGKEENGFEIIELLNENLGKPFDDKKVRNYGKYGKKISIVKSPDSNDKSGLIYDISGNVFSKDGKIKIGSVIIGFSNSIIREKIREAIKVVLFISLIIFSISIVAAVILTRILTGPIRILSYGASQIGKGNYDHVINIKSRDELGRLANEFNEMTSQIKDFQKNEIESRIMEEQLELAREIQEGLNPMGYYDKRGIQIKGFTRAAKGVGGDYFDYIDIDENKVGALISDVSGKGVPASLVMVMIRTVFTLYVKMGNFDCSQVVTAINDSLSADFAIDKFATLFFLIYDREKEEVSFSNAGHGPLFCYRASLGACTATKLDGMPIGIMEDITYSQAKVKLNPGDMIVMYTDGVTEMRNSEKEEYGLKRVQKLMLEQPHLSAGDFVDLLVKDVDDFKGDVAPHDDETLLVFKREMS